jgi:SAM-dependent methyltransferase
MGVLTINPASDPLGQALLDYLNGTCVSDIVVHSSMFYPDILPVKQLFRSYNEMPDIEKKALDLCKGHILDVGAGAGPHSLWLQEQGRRVTALESEKKAKKVLEKRGIEDIVASGYFDYSGQQFDTILLLMNGIGICGDMDGLDRFFRNSGKLLKPGGQILLDSSDIAYIFEEEEPVKPEEKYYGVVDFRMEYQGVIGEEFNWLYVDFETLKQGCRRHGYTCELVLEDGNHAYLAKMVMGRG